MRIESLLVLFLIGSSGCSLLAPSDSELSGAWGVGGQAGFPASGNGDQANDAGQGSGGDSGGSESTPNGAAADAGESGSDTGPSAGKSAGGTGGVAGAGVAKGGTGTSSGGTLGAAGAGGAGKVAGAGAGGGTGGGAGAGVAKGGTGAGGTLGAAGAGGAGKVGGAGAGGAVSYCAAKPCVRGTCSEVTNGYKCTCPAGWGGTTCAVGSCSTLSCPASAPCKVPDSKVVAICYPSACVGKDGLCMAENTDGSGDTIVLQGRNPDFAMVSAWTNRAKYFAYIDNLHGKCACVFPQTGEAGTPLVIPLYSARTKTTGFGQSNSWSNPPTCTCP